MNTVRSTESSREPAFYGVYRALVVDIQDPTNRGRVQVRLPGLADSEGGDLTLWAAMCTPYADRDHGLVILPEVNSQVVVAFEGGELRHPFVIGSTWSDHLPLPHFPTPGNDIRLLRTRGDSRLEFDDGATGPKISMSTQSGHQVVLDAGAAEVTVTHSNGSTIRITAAGDIEITAGSAVNVTAPSFTVDAPVATFSGVVNCQTLIAGVGVVSPSYTPGAGNIW
ncbi:hypothetical protein GA707_05870 [Nostocoides sp. F2B08]|uniref:phage baseplate assembly protein V n=1 Tax=Nostocoides sp. F2B08 TaxID=2653936 RepID=UPI00126333A7|nr:phage baseplate assembly protein V [Tetrasphaera sp. F2B08]KAB7745453.1 hypothetical protein GA707_05870 [Tetrasphaera sp. F2B08]